MAAIASDNTPRQIFHPPTARIRSIPYFNSKQ
jgi:hypothetical protein